MAPCEFWIESLFSSNAFPVMACSYQCHTRQCVNVVWIRPILSTVFFWGVYVRSYTYCWLKRLMILEHVFFRQKRLRGFKFERGYKKQPGFNERRSWLRCAWAKFDGHFWVDQIRYCWESWDGILFFQVSFQFLTIIMKANFNINQLMVSYSCGLTLTALLSFFVGKYRDKVRTCGQAGR